MVNYKKLYEAEMARRKLAEERARAEKLKNKERDAVNKVLQGRVNELVRENKKITGAVFKNIGKGNPFNYKFSKRLATTMVKQNLVSFTKRTASIKFGMYKGVKLNMDFGEFISELKEAFNKSRDLDTSTLQWMKLYINSKKIESGFYGNDYGDKVGDTERLRGKSIIEEFEMTDHQLNSISPSQKKRFMKYVKNEKYDLAENYAEKIVGSVSKRDNRNLIEMIFRKWM